MKIAVFTGDVAYSVRKGIAEIDRAVEGTSWLIVLHAPQKGVRRLLRNQWANLRRNGWRWIPYQLSDVAQRLSARWSGSRRASALGLQYTMEGLLGRGNVDLIRVRDIHAQETLDRVTAFAPDLGLSLAAPILRKSLFSIPRLGTINLHKGKVPDYRGMPPAFWELWNDESRVGCTVHFVDAKLDTGGVVAETTIDREEFSTLRGLQLRLDEAGIDLMTEVVQRISNGAAQSKPQPSGGKTYRKPTLLQVQQLRKRLPAPARQWPGKNLVAKMSFELWRAGLGNVFAPRVVVLLYHRVSDSVRDNLTVGIEQFDQHMALLAERCDVLSIQDVLRCDRIERSARPRVCVTFDDGYLDNFTNAVPILLRHRIPAAFFVATGIIGTDGRFPHDLRRGNPPIPVMQWDQLREMHRLGFTIGSHSVSHIDCASEPEDVVWGELVRSRNDLKRELGLSEVLFAYPYGGRQHMTKERLELVKKAGYGGCLSAYGGANTLSVDRYNVLRRGIQWEFSNQALLFECLGLT
jgi:peptidoglycan/xylan/chitin deacetylase (PgdA/CDA1 family)